MTKRSQKATKGNGEARVYALLSAGGKTQTDIAVELGVSREYVSRIAQKFRADLDAQADATKAAAIDGAAEAREMARKAAPEAMRVLEREMLEADSSADRRAAAVALLDRAGVGTKVDVGLKVEPLSIETAAQVAAIVRAVGAREDDGQP